MKEFLQRIEKLSPKRLALLTCELQSRLDKLERQASEPIAIVGLGCRLPGGANSPESFWDQMAEGRDAVCEVPAGRWDINAWHDADPDAPGRMCSRGGAASSTKSIGSTPRLFDIQTGSGQHGPATAHPDGSLLGGLETHAGQSPRELNGTRTGVYLGLATADYHSLLLARGTDAIDAYLATGTAHSVAAGDGSAYVLGLHGPNLPSTRPARHRWPPCTWRVWACALAIVNWRLPAASTPSSRRRSLSRSRSHI